VTQADTFSGGCQCGAVRFRASHLGRPSICHCRMCQKAFGSFFGPLVTADHAHFEWTRGAPSLFRSSAKIHRGFCGKCGTPLTYQSREGIEIAIGAFDHPEFFQPQIQVNHKKRLPWIEQLFEAPILDNPQVEAMHAAIESWQHPDHDTDKWPED
jgi:hypothetical protein